MRFVKTLIKLAIVLAIAAAIGTFMARRASGQPARTPTYDLLVRNGTVLDGSGAAGARADGATSSNGIVRMSPTRLSPVAARMQ